MVTARNKIELASTLDKPAIILKEPNLADSVVLAITMMTLGQISLSVTLLLVRSFKSAPALPLAIFFLANGVIALGPAVMSLNLGWYTIYIAFVFPALFSLSPALWLYIEGLTSDDKWRLKAAHLAHFALFGVGLLITVLVLCLSQPMREEIFIAGADVQSGLPLVVVVSIFVAMLLWLGQSIVTVIRIIHRLVHYRKQLRDLFSNNEHRELNWINWLLFIALSSWLVSFTALFLSNLFAAPLFSQRLEASLTLILIWTLAYFGLQQKPGLAKQPILVAPGIGSSVETNSAKYQRSALTQDQAKRIADKMNTAMAEEKLYLDSNLSLHKLATFLVISPNYISQTLNETLNVNFFDYVNQWRIEAAKEKIIANQNTVLHIALEVGFNARSSFYKAFKQQTGKTPSEFRKQHMT